VKTETLPMCGLTLNHQEVQRNNQWFRSPSFSVHVEGSRYVEAVGLKMNYKLLIR